MRCKLILAVAALAIVGAVGCQRAESEAEIQARRDSAQADSVRMAEDMYDATVFDTISWESPQARLERGAVVYRSSCGKCHGTNGGGNGEDALRLQIEVPSFLDPAWEHAGDVGAIRHATYVGHVGWMPEWGLIGLKYKDLDAVSAYIAETLAPESTQE
ncbi:MAG: c-type cytochrome [Gemmatimonadales bacterium]|jgi:mono/diheme cytochrome c family protein